MAITRAQQAKQMLRDGGMSLQEAKDMAPEGEFLAYINPKEAKMLKAAGGSGVMTKAGIPSFIDYGDVESGLAGGEFGGGSPEDTFGGGGDDQEDDNARMMQAMNLTKAANNAALRDANRFRSDNRLESAIKLLSPFSKERQKAMYNLSMGIPGQKKRSATYQKAYKDYLESLGITEEDLEGQLPSTDFFVDKGFIDKPKSQDAMLPEPMSYGDFLLKEFNNPTVKYRGDIGAYRREMGLDNDSQPIIPLIPRIATDVAEEDELAKALSNRTAYRFMADGGIMGGLADGQMDEMGRQMYGLGKLVKKVTRTAKKIVKSPIGKAAIAGYFLGGGNLGGILKSRPGFSFAKLGSSLGLGTLSGGEENIFTGGPFSSIANIVRDKFTSSGLTGKVGLGITAASLLPLLGLGTGEESEEEAQSILQSKGIDIADIRANPQKYQAMRFMAEGGSTEKEPVAKKTMPLLDMDGMEKDYRAEGGFVPIGRMEKADDVPARLSKNEFVFTADAVRNAGDGDVDKGAEVMYNMMKNLEAGGDVSEESQGLEGARKMFQTSQRLEEVL